MACVTEVHGPTIPPPEDWRMRTCYFSNGQHRWTVKTYYTGIYERPSMREGIAFKIWEDGKLVRQSESRHDVVRCSPMDSMDSDSAMRALIALVCHEATHDEDDARKECAWAADDLDEAAACRWPDL